MLRVVAFTGKLGGYYAMRPLLQMIDADPEVRLTLVAGDQHTQSKFGHTSTQICEDFPFAWMIDVPEYGDTATERSEAMMSLGSIVAGSGIIEGQDVALIYGDRMEALMVASICCTYNTPVWHLQAGDRTGGQDDRIRQAITGLSSVALCSTADAATRISGRDGYYTTSLSSLSEPGYYPDYSREVFLVGDHHVDRVRAWVSERKPKKGKHFLVHYHPDTLSPHTAKQEFSEIIKAIQEFPRHNVVALYPCSDIGHEPIIELLEEMRGVGWTVLTYLPADNYLMALAEASCIIGNSSAGVIEAPYLETTSVNIGPRQDGRPMATSVISAHPERRDIEMAIRIALSDERRVFERLYGDGRACKKTYNLLKELNHD